MNKDKQKALESAGYTVGDAEQFLEIPDFEIDVEDDFDYETDHDIGN